MEVSLLRRRLFGIKRMVNLGPASLRYLGDYLRDLREWEKGWRRFHADPLPAPTGKLNVFCSVAGPIFQAKTDCLLAAALRRRGERVAFLIQRDQHWPYSVEPYYRAAGLGEILYWDDLGHLTPAELDLARTAADEVLAGDPGVDELVRWRFRGADSGVHALSTVSRHLRVGRLDPTDPQARDLLRSYLQQTNEAVLRSEKIISQLGCDRVGFSDRGYFRMGAFCDVALREGLDVFQLVGSFRDDALVLKRYTETSKRMHPISLSAPSWTRLLDEGWSPRIREVVLREQEERYSGKWYFGSREQIGKKMLDAQGAREMLGLDPAKRTATVFSHILWDSNLFYGEDLFEDFGEWLMETVRAAYANPNVNWLIKLHPANVWKAQLEGVPITLDELHDIKRELGEPPAHVKIVPPDHPLNTYSFMLVSDFCVTVRGTIGVEMAARGKKVLCAGTGRYSHLGFTLDFDTREQYLDRLRSLHLEPPMTEEERRRAEAYAYGLFYRRPWRLTSMRRTFRPSSEKFHPLAYNYEWIPEGQRSASDMGEFADWLLRSGDEDYLAAPAAEGDD